MNPVEPVPENAKQETPTSLEISLFREGEGFRIDLSNLPIFFGLSILAKDIGEKVISRHYLDRVDVEVEKKVKRSETPELAELQIENIKVACDYEVLDPILTDKEAFIEDLTVVFGSLQMQRWRKYIYPGDPNATSRALVFVRSRSLETGAYPFRIILERLRSSKKADKFFLRAVIEGLDRRCLDLGSLPHVLVENPEGRSFIAGSTRLSQMLFEQVRWEARRGKRTYSEISRMDSYIFSRLHEAGMKELEAVEISWTEGYIELFRSMEPKQLTGIFKKILLLLEDHPVRALLKSGKTIRADFGDIFANMDFSQLGRTLNLSFGHKRRMFGIDQYLLPMPDLLEIASERKGQAPLKGISVLLIHHITAEVLALIAAMKDLGVEDVYTLFVHYGEEVPSDFLEALLNLHQNRFRCYSLNNVEEPLSVEGYFVLSPRFSLLKGLEPLNKRMYRDKPKYMEAMVQTASQLFLEMLLKTIRHEGKCLVVEDGGYLSPSLSEWAADGRNLADLLQESDMDPTDGIGETARMPVADVLDRWMIGTVEHTRNGLDRLASVLRERGALARPAFSIAISEFKVTEEAREVATSILSAIESVLHAQGKVLSRRRVAVIGSSGTIGKHLVEQIGTRCAMPESRPCLQVDLKRPDFPSKEVERSFAFRFEDLPPERISDVDLVIGVTGQPAFGWEDTERLLMEGAASTFYFASGSTKTIEFERVSQGLETILRMKKPAVRGYPLRVESSEINDPQTRRLLGYRYRLLFESHPMRSGEGVVKEICFLGSLMPINFLFYGVPGEMIDPVLSQLLRSSLGLVRRVAGDRPPAKSLYAVDHDIDEDGNPLENPSR